MSHAKATLCSAAVAIGALCSLALASSAAAKSHVKETLTATSAAPHAHGRATLALKTVARGRFRVSAKGLAKNAAFDLVVGGVKVGSFTTNGAGSGKIKLSTHPRGSDTFLGVDPRGQSIAVRDEHGEDDLQGDMPDGEDSASGAFVCCKSHDDDNSQDDMSSDDRSSDEEVECDLETPSECADEGGTTVVDVDSCIPNPCGETPPDNEVVCCFPGSETGANVDGEFEPECQDVSAQQCALTGGIIVEGESCEDNPCLPSPPSDLTVCCIPGESQDGKDDDQGNESECEVLTVEHCSAVGGTASAARSCDDDPCEHDGSSDD